MFSCMDVAIQFAYIMIVIDQHYFRKYFYEYNNDVFTSVCRLIFSSNVKFRLAKTSSKIDHYREKSRFPERKGALTH